MKISLILLFLISPILCQVYPLDDFNSAEAMAEHNVGMHWFDPALNGIIVRTYCITGDQTCNGTEISNIPLRCKSWANREVRITKVFVNVTGLCKIERQFYNLLIKYREVVKVVHPYLYASIGLVLIIVLQIIKGMIFLHKNPYYDIEPFEPGKEAPKVVINAGEVQSSIPPSEPSAPSTPAFHSVCKLDPPDKGIELETVQAPPPAPASSVTQVIIQNHDMYSAHELSRVSTNYNSVRQYVKWDLTMKVIIIAVVVGINVVYNLSDVTVEE